LGPVPARRLGPDAAGGDPAAPRRGQGRHPAVSCPRRRRPGGGHRVPRYAQGTARRDSALEPRRDQTGQEVTKRPTKAELLAARNKTVDDLIAPGLTVLFCGINPGLYSAATGHHFARPGNRFWRALFAAGFTDRLFHPSEEHELLPLGYGITNVATRATASADELTDEELVAGGRRLRAKVKKLAPRYLAVLGVGAYRVA